MNMSYVPTPPEFRLQQIRQQLQEIQLFILRHHTNANKRLLFSKAQEWGWQVKSYGKNHPDKACRSGYGAIPIPGHGNGRPLKKGLGSILQSLAEPVVTQLKAEAAKIEQRLQQEKLQHTQAQIITLQNTIEEQKQQLCQKEQQIQSLHADLEVGLTLAAEVEAKNGHLARQLTDLMKDRLAIEHLKRKIQALMQDYAKLEQKMLASVEIIERQEEKIEQHEKRLAKIREWAETLPWEFRQLLLALLLG